MNTTKKNSVLIVDDDNSNIVAFTDMLSPEFTIYAVKNGQAAIRAAEKFLPDVILLDIIMPEMDGYEVIAALKSSPKTREIPVIFITSLDSAEEEEKGLALGAADYIIKPSNSAIVKLRVKNQIKIEDQQHEIEAFKSDLIKYMLTSDALKIGLWDMDVVSGDPINPNNTFTWSREFRHMLGYSDESDFPNILSSWSDLLHPEDKEITLNAFAAHISDRTGKTPYDLEYRLMLKNGHYGNFHAFGNTLRQEGTGIPLRVAGALMDITEKKRMEREISRANKRTKILLDKTPLCCQLLNSDLNIIDCNEAAVELFGFKDKQEYLKRYTELNSEYQPDGERSDEKIAKNVKKAFDEGKHAFDWTYRMLDGTSMPAEIILIRVEYEDGYAVAGYTRDMREQQAMLAEMRRAEIAEENSKAKSKFLAMMSHEIRTPMNAILGITEIHLQDETLESKYEEAFNKIYNSGNLLLGIINDLLDMSKIEADKLELVLAKYEIASLINDVVSLNLMRFNSRPLKLELDVDGNTPAALIGDELRIKQILNNLLSNSFKYTKQGTVKLSVFAETGDERKESRMTLVFRVSDTGMGMTEEQLSKLFDEYSRFNTEANRVTEGAGLGMHITRNLVRMMNGEIMAESEIDKGTTITVRLPQEDAGAGILGMEIVENLRRLENNKAAYEKRAQIVHELMPYGRVLVVDDSDLNLFVARGLLLPYELVIDTAESGFEAIDIIKSGREYDIVFMDHMMPEMDGIETVKNMRGLGYSRPIVALTADAVSGRSDMFLKNGFDDFISKPIDIRHLDSVLKKLVRDAHPREVIEAARAASKQRADAHNAESEEASAFLDAVNKIGAINMKIGLSRFSGVEDMYYNTLALFHKKLPRECDAMSDFVNTKDMKGFSIVVHSIKSQLATIGAMELSKTAQTLETASKNNVTDYCVNYFTAFKENLLALYAQLSAVFSGEEVSAEKAKKESGDPEYLGEHIEKALEAAGYFDEDTAIEDLNKLRAYDYGDEINALLDDALSALGDFDFDYAGEILNKILKLRAAST